MAASHITTAAALLADRYGFGMDPVHDTHFWWQTDLGLELQGRLTGEERQQVEDLLRERLAQVKLAVLVTDCLDQLEEAAQGTEGLDHINKFRDLCKWADPRVPDA